MAFTNYSLNRNRNDRRIAKIPCRANFGDPDELIALAESIIQKIIKVANDKIMDKNKKINISYKVEGNLDRGIRESIELSVEIEPDDNYPDTLQFLKSRALQDLDEETRNRHGKLKEEFEETARNLVDITEKLESAYKHWDLVTTFLKNQGIKTDTAEFPQEALNALIKSLPPTSFYPE